MLIKNFSHNHPKFREVKLFVKNLSRFYPQVYLALTRFYLYLRVRLDELLSIIAASLKNKDNGKWHLLLAYMHRISHLASIPSSKRYLSNQILYIMDLQKS